MKKVLNFVKGKKDDKKDSKAVNSHISVEITNPSGHKVPSEDEHIIGLQLGYGYDVDLNGKDRGMTKIHKAAWQGNLDKLKIHIKKFDINLTDDLNRTPLHFACAHGHTNIVSYLLNNKAVSDIYDSDGMTPLLKAVECGVKDCVSILIDKGVDVNVADINGNTSLHLAAKHGFFNIMSILLKNGANYDCSNNIGEMPLHIATDQEHGELVELLLRFGAHVNVVDRDNRTPLMLAARNGISTLVTLFTAHGAHLDACDSNGWTAEDYALIGGHEQLAAELKVPVTELHIDETSTIKNNFVNTAASPHETANQDENTEKTNAEEEIDTIQEMQKTNEGVKSPPTSILIIEEDSPRSCVTPPPLKPPRSWEMIQAGMIDQTQVQRRSLMTLGTLRSRRESFNDASGGTSPHSGQADNTHIRIEEAIKIASEDCNMKASSDTEWDSEDSLPADCVLPSNLMLPITPDRRSRITLERTPSVDLTDDEHSENKILLSEDFLPEAGEAQDDKHTQLGNDIDINTGKNNNNINTNTRQYNQNINNNIIIYDTGQKNSVISEDCIKSVSNEVYKSIVESKTRLDKDIKYNSIGMIDQKVRESCSLDNLDDIKKTHVEITDFHSCSDLDKESLNTTENLYSGAFSLDTLDAETSTNDGELAQSLDSLDESPLGTVVKKNIFRESQSLDVLEDLRNSCTSTRPARKHVRNKSICMNSQCWSKSVDVLSRPCNANKLCIDKKNIDAQLECYDEALRELAEAEKLKKNTSSRTSDKSNISISRQETYTITIESEVNTKELNSFVESGQNISDKKADLPIQKNKIQNSVTNNKELDVNRIEKGVDSNTSIDLQVNTKSFQELQSTSIDIILPNEKETTENLCTQLKTNILQSDILKLHSEQDLNTKHDILCTKDKNKNPAKSNCQDNENTDKISENYILKEHNATENSENLFSLPYIKLMYKKEKSEVNTKAEDNVKEKKFCKPVAVYTEQIMNNDDNTKRNKQEIVLSEKSESDSDWHERPIRNKRKQLLAMRGVIADSKDSDDSIEEDPPFWMSTDKGGCFTRQDTVVFQPPNINTPTNTPQPKFNGKPVVSDLNLKTKSSTEGEGEDSSASSEADSGSLSQSDATPQHTYTLRNHQSLLKEHLRQATSEKARLEEFAAQLKDQNSRLEYELADIIQVVAVRDDTIRILQEQLARLEAKHSVTLDEVHSLKHKLNTSEVELKHLRDLITKSNLERERKNADVDKSYQEILKRLEEVIQANKQVKAEKEALIAQNITDIKKLQEDTLHWKDMYEDAVNKLEQIQGTCEPHLKKTMQKVDALQVTIKKLQDEKHLENERWCNRLMAEEQLKKEFEIARQKLLLELTKVQTALKDKEAEEKLLREHYEKLTLELEKSEELKHRELIEKSYNMNLTDQITIKGKELAVTQSVFPPSTLSSPPTPPPPPPPPPLPLLPMTSFVSCMPTDEHPFSAKSLRQQLENHITRHRGEQVLLDSKLDISTQEF